MGDCKHTETDRIGLYIMVFILLICGPCSYTGDITQINDKLDHLTQYVENIDN